MISFSILSLDVLDVDAHESYYTAGITNVFETESYFLCTD